MQWVLQGKLQFGLADGGSDRPEAAVRLRRTHRAISNRKTSRSAAAPLSTGHDLGLSRFGSVGLCLQRLSSEIRLQAGQRGRILKALLLEGERRLSLLDIDAPVAGPGQVFVDVEVASIGGSEYLGYKNPGIRRLPNIMGHGIAGVTAEGRRVAVNPLQSCGTCDDCLRGRYQLCSSWELIGVQSNGGFAQKVVVPATALVDLPDDLSWEQAAFVEPFANSVNAWELSGADTGDTVAIVGAGGLGLGLVACAAEADCEEIAVADLSSGRLRAATELGANSVSADLTGRYDVVFDTVGSAEARQKAIALTRKSGTCVLLGFATPMLEIDAGDFIRSQKRIVGAFVYSVQHFMNAIQLVRRCRREWVTNLTFLEVEPLLLKYLDGDFSTVKAALRPNR